VSKISALFYLNGHHLLTLMLFQTCMTFYRMWCTKYKTLFKSIGFHSMENTNRYCNNMRVNKDRGLETAFQDGSCLYTQSALSL